MTENLLAGAAPAEPAATDPAPGTPPAADTPPATDPATPPADAPKEGDAPKEAEKPAGPPEKYEDFKLPDGMQADETQLGEFQDFARDLGLSQEAAQKLLDRYGAIVQEPANAYQALQETWIGEIKADKEIGGANLEKSLGMAAKALDQFGGAQLREALNVTGAGNHPAIVKAFVMIGKAISEDSFVSGGTTGAGARDIADRLYGSN